MPASQFTPFTGGTLSTTVTAGATESVGRILIGPQSRAPNVRIALTLTPATDPGNAYPVHWIGAGPGVFAVAPGDVITATATDYPEDAADAPRVHLETYTQ